METVGPPPPLRFSSEDSDRANDLWSANCGPHAFAAAMNMTLEEVLRYLPDFPYWGSTSIDMLYRGLRGVRAPFYLKSKLRTKDLCTGLSRIQWEGEWTKPGRPIQEAWKHGHLVAQIRGHVYCTATPWREWIPYAQWRAYIDSKYGPWHITDHLLLLKAPNSGDLQTGSSASKTS